MQLEHGVARLQRCFFFLHARHDTVERARLAFFHATSLLVVLVIAVMPFSKRFTEIEERKTLRQRKPSEIW